MITTPMGRKNWLFCWTELGAWHVGIIESLLTTCRLYVVGQRFAGETLLTKSVLARRTLEGLLDHTGGRKHRGRVQQAKEILPMPACGLAVIVYSWKTHWQGHRF